jgi:hypothetical protein
MMKSQIWREIENCRFKNTCIHCSLNCRHE